MKYTLLLLLFSISVNIQATVITGNANNYYTLVPLLTPGDTLMLHPGTYPWGLNIYDLTGTDSARIVIIGAPAYGSVFTGSPGVNTVSIKTSAYVSIYNIKIDGMQVSDDIDAVKAEGTSGNWAHHITLDGLWITGYDLDRNQVGISNKCPAWDWVIRNCTINTAGTGMYLGSSLGTEPFINGIIENCLIINTIGYNIEIKRQNDGLRTLPGMTLNGKTIIRNNVFSKGANSSGGDVSRPNLLLGGFPATGDGSNDRYEVYGNFFYQNPSEGLLQATGNHAIYNNIFYNNMGGWGIAIMSHEGHAPRLSDVFHNTVIVDGEDGIYYSGLDTNYASSQHCYANVSFSSTNPFVNIPVDNAENISGDYTDASTYLNNVTSNIPGLDAFPKAGMLTGSLMSSSLFQTYPDWDKDFNGTAYDWTYRGAYSRKGINPGWKLNLEMMPVKQGGTTLIKDFDKTTEKIYLYPNPANNYVTIETGESNLTSGSLTVFNALGQAVYNQNNLLKNQTKIETSNFQAGVYFVKITTNSTTSTGRFVVE